MQVDPAFRTHRQSARRRRRRSLALRLALIAPVLAMIIGAGLWWLWPATGPGTDGPTATIAATGDMEQQLVQVEPEFDVAPVVQADTFTDLPGDPLILRLSGDEDTARQSRGLPGPDILDIGRVGLPAPDRLTLVREGLHVRQRQLMAALPTSREEFALFQTQRAAPPEDALAPVAGPAPIDPLAMDTAADALPPPAETTLLLRPEHQRIPLSQDMIIDLQLATPMAALLTDNGFSANDAAAIAAQAAVLTGGGDADAPLPAGSVLALRFQPDGDRPRLMQLSLYGPEGWRGSAARGSRGQLVTASDPWLDTDIVALAAGEDDATNGASGQQFRLLDAIYSAAIRAQVPTELVGETIAMMAQVHDLDSVADERDRLTMIFARDHGAGGQLAGQVLYAGVSGPSGDRHCYVVPRDGTTGFRCFAPGARMAQAAGSAANRSLTMPVAGSLRRKFGLQGSDGAAITLPGIEFSAPQGTPVQAAAAGTVMAVGQDRSIGLNVIVDHGAGLVTRYGGLAGTAPGLAAGKAVTAGAPIGAVGVIEGAKDPGLFFQVLQNDVPVDPAPFLTGGQTVMASNAVETLIGRIIRVESAGNARAKNPLSTATGLGQFIESTWLRMMRSYRPDLVAAMSRPQLLELRFDPDMSREMVKRLAQENEAYLRARGHAISSGRLYLAHFLGPEGANRVLSSADGQTIMSVMGAGVVNANPFLARYTVADLKGWADRKMQSAPVDAATPAPVAEAPPSPAVVAFVAAMDALLAQPG